MRSFPLDLDNVLDEEAVSICHLLEIQLLSTTLRYTDFNMDVPFDGNMFISRGFSFDAVQYSLLPKVDTFSFDLDDVDGEITRLVLTEEVRNRPCTLYKAALDTNLKIIGSPIIMFPGYLDSVRGSEQPTKVSVEVFNHFIRWQMKTPRGIHAPACPWTFKDPDTCQYAGNETWCDYSYDRCSFLNNTDHFRGFRFILSIQNVQTWWGRTQA